MYSSMPLTAIKGIGPKKAAALNELGITSCEELACCLPADYKDRGILRDFSLAEEGEYILTEGVFTSGGKTQYIGKNRTKTVLNFVSSSGGFVCVYYNFPYIAANLQAGESYRLYGRVLTIGKKLCIVNPAMEKAENITYLTEGLYAIYDLPNGCGIKQKEFSFFIKSCLEKTESFTEMPLKIALAFGALDKDQSLRMVHFPADENDIFEGGKYFAAENFLSFRSANDRVRVRAEGVVMESGCAEDLIASFGFALTDAQKKAIAEIGEDLSSGKRMNRLLDGDVGSGKTAVAIWASFVAAKNGFQALFCAPTQVLAQQHYQKYAELLTGLGVKCLLVTAKMSASEKKYAADFAENEESAIIFGTHALFSEKLKYKNVALAVIDEQQRFGVAQRAELESKGDKTHVLVMSATPIPRTLALSIYKDLDISVIDEMPKGRKKVKTYIVNREFYPKIADKITSLAKRGLHSFVVCPAIDAEDMENVEESCTELKKMLPTLKIKKLTAQTKPDEAARIMADFHSGKTDVLVATTIIEVGVDDANACVMWIKGAERFGLSQLHQLRGRVGRGNEESYCFLEPSSGIYKAPERLKIIKENTDGFAIANEDLNLRGSGDVFGLKQSGKQSGIISDVLRYRELYIKSEEVYESLKVSSNEKDKAYLSLIRQRALSEYAKITMD